LKRVGDIMEAKVLRVKHEGKAVCIELTALPAHVDLEGDILDQSQLLPSDPADFEQRFLGKSFLAVVKKVNSGSQRPLFLELSNFHFGFCSAFDGIVPVEEVGRL